MEVKVPVVIHFIISKVKKTEPPILLISSKYILIDSEPSDDSTSQHGCEFLQQLDETIELKSYGRVAGFHKPTNIYYGSS